MIYAKGLENDINEAYWHIVKDMFAGDGCISVWCGYPEMPEFPRQSGRFLPTMMAAPYIENNVCEKCQLVREMSGEQIGSTK
jgi:hypothetical protein